MCVLPLWYPAQRSYLDIDGTSFKGAVDVHATCYAPRCTPSLPRDLFAIPTFFAALPSPIHMGTGDQPEEPIKVFANNVRGIKAQAVAAWLSVLQPDIVLLQEVWDLQRGIDLPPSNLMHFRSSAEGRGTGLHHSMVQVPHGLDRGMQVLHDGDHWTAVHVRWLRIGRVVLVHVHLHLDLTWAQKADHIKQWKAMRTAVKPNLMVLQGDLNVSDVPNSPLGVALGLRGALADMVRVLPPGTPTNFTTYLDEPRATSIDHAFTAGRVNSSAHQLLPTGSSHQALYITLRTSTPRSDPFYWKKFK